MERDHLACSQATVPMTFAVYKRAISAKRYITALEENILHNVFFQGRLCAFKLDKAKQKCLLQLSWHGLSAEDSRFGAS